MDRLLSLYNEFGQSPWLDNLKRDYITSGELTRLVANGVRGLTSNPTIFQKAIQGSADYDEQFRALAAEGRPVIEDYWSMVLQDINSALDVFAPVYHQSYGADGYVSVEVDPGLAHDAAGTETAARILHESIDRPNLMVKIPATLEGLPAIQQMIAEGRSINVTLIFSLARYEQVMEAYLAGLEQYAATPGADLSKVASVASFFISRVDSEIDHRLDAIGSPDALALRGTGAVAQGKLAYQSFQRTFSGPRWEALKARGAVVQRPLWASTSTKNPAYPDTLYVDELIGPDTVNTLPDATLEAFADHGNLARRVDADVDQAAAAWKGLAAVGVDLDEVADKLERDGVASFQKSFDELLGALAAKADELRAG
jgi:transaldolase